MKNSFDSAHNLYNEAHQPEAANQPHTLDMFPNQSEWMLMARFV